MAACREGKKEVDGGGRVLSKLCGETLPPAAGVAGGGGGGGRGVGGGGGSRGS